MGLRDALVPMDSYVHDIDAYMDAVLDAAELVGGEWPLIRLELGHAITLTGPNDTPCGVSLWVDREAVRSESWQKVSVMVCAATWAEAAGQFLTAIERREAVKAATA